MNPSPMDVYVLSRVLSDQPVNGELPLCSSKFRPMIEHLAGLPLGDRSTAFQAVLTVPGLDSTAIIDAMSNVDPKGPPPVAVTAGRCATLADVRSLVANTQWLWEGWLAAGVLNGLAADPGIGKTILSVDLARRLWFDLDWPDGQKNTIPAGTKTLWVPGDRHYHQLLELANNFGLPDEALLFNAPDSDATGGLDLDDPDELAALKDRVQGENPGLVFIDTVGMTTARNLCRPEDARAYFGPLMDLARDVAIPILPLTHLSRDGQALGRRINGACRLVWKLTHPDPDQPDRRRLWVDKTYALKPPHLGMTIATAGCAFDSNPPSEPAPDKGGNPGHIREKAKQFIRDALAKQNDQIGNGLCADWEKGGESGKTFWRAVKDLTEAGTIATDGGKGTGKQTVLHLIDPTANTTHP